MFDSTRVCSSPQVVPATTGNVPALRGSVSINISQSELTVHRQDEEQEKKKVKRGKLCGTVVGHEP